MSLKHSIEVPAATHNVSGNRVKKNKAVPALSQEGNNLLSTSANKCSGKGSSKAITAACTAKVEASSSSAVASTTKACVSRGPAKDSMALGTVHKYFFIVQLFFCVKIARSHPNVKAFNCFCYF